MLANIEVSFICGDKILPEARKCRCFVLCVSPLGKKFLEKILQLDSKVILSKEECITSFYSTKYNLFIPKHTILSD